MDWTVIRRGRDKLSAFAGVLGFSRFSFARIAEDEKLGTPIDCHERFFDAVGGVPLTISTAPAKNGWEQHLRNFGTVDRIRDCQNDIA